MAKGALIVFTAKSTSSILEAGGTQSWVLNPSNMTAIEYVVCTRNADRKFDEECGHRPEPHRAAFLVGKVSGIRKVGVFNGRDRYIILFSEYAEVLIPKFRGHERNPVTYGDTDSLRIKGLDISKLKFKPMPKAEGLAAAGAATSAPATGLSIEEAKKGLSARYGIAEANIQIVMTG
jgi:hypothetical protein